MAFDAQGFRKAALQAGIPQKQVDEAIAQRTGVKGWLTSGKTGLAGVASGVGNVLNLPSYALGGVLNQGQRAFGSKYGQKTDATGLGVLEGIKSKRGVFTEAPETLGIDPSSGLGMAIGFGAELLTPNIPVGKLANLNKFRKTMGIGSKIANVSSKTGNLIEDVGQAALLKSYKLNKTNINKLADALGIVKESEKAPGVIKYLESLGMRGANSQSLSRVEDIIAPLQNKYNQMVRSGQQVSRADYAKELLQQAKQLETFAGDPNTRRIVLRLKDEARIQQNLAKQGVSMTDEFLTNTKTSAFSAASGSQLTDPFTSGINEQIGRAGVNALEKYAPGSSDIGTQLKKLRAVSETVGGQANTGLGTQLFNALKPSAAGFGIGAATGYASGQNPLIGGAIGAAGNIALNNPRVLNTIGKGLSGGVKLPKIPSNTITKTGLSALQKTPITAFRVGQQPTSNQRLTPSVQSTQEQVKPVSYNNSIARPKFTVEQFKTKKPKNVFNNAAFGKTFTLKAGSFN